MSTKAELLSIGTELLLGQIVDTNANYLAGRLALLGIDCLHMQTVGDNLGRAKQAFERALARSDLVVATGGLGPTEDDLTREAIAAALGETAVEEKLAELVHSTSPTVATYAKNDGVHVRVADKASTPEEADRHVAEMERAIRARLGEYVWGTDDETLPSVIGRRLEARKWRLAVAESLSAGDIARSLADAPDAARWFARAVVRPASNAETLENEGRRLGI